MNLWWRRRRWWHHTDINECLQGNPCGTGANCINVIGSYLCACPEGTVGNPLYACQPPRPGTDREGSGCTLSQTCPRGLICYRGSCTRKDMCADDSFCPPDNVCAVINNEAGKQCVDPCDNTQCGHNAYCLAQNHTASCSCPANYTGDAWNSCDEIKPECTVDNECLVGHICDNFKCIPRCRHDNNCPEEDVCLNGQCQNPCLLANACGPNAKCTPYQHRPRCECKENHMGNPFVGCDPIPDDYCESDKSCPLGNICETNRCVAGCRSDLHCHFEEACINKVCQNPCSVYGACGSNSACKPVNHDRVCSCLPDFTGDPRTSCEKVKPPPECTSDNQCLLGQICDFEKCVSGCRTSSNCPSEESCVRDQCLNACSISGACGKGASCTPSNHVAVCSCPSGFRGDPEVECREIPPECRIDDDCGLEKICLRHKCIPGCRTHGNCPFDKACVNGFCQTPCDIGGVCGVNTICRAERHEAHCSCSPGYTGDPLKQCTKVFVECEQDPDCGTGYVCAHNQCKDINECLKETLPCGPGASCQNLPGWYKCSCPLPLLGNAYGPEGCRPPAPVCFHDADCPKGNKCDAKSGECFEAVDVRQPPVVVVQQPPGCQSDHECPTNRKCDAASSHDCYDPCTTTVPELQCHCGLNAFCQTVNHEATCSCPPGFEGYPDKVCLPIRECNVTYNCPGNLICLDSHTCGCPPMFFRENDYCFIRSQNCTTTNPCDPNEECIYTGDQSGMCVCPHGYELLPYGECRQISFCEGSNLCAPGGICRDKPGGYECLCPVDTIGDPYLKGCTPITGCTTDHDCPSDRECDTGSKQCISKCSSLTVYLWVVANNMIKQLHVISVDRILLVQPETIWRFAFVRQVTTAILTTRLTDASPLHPFKRTRLLEPFPQSRIFRSHVWLTEFQFPSKREVMRVLFMLKAIQTMPTAESWLHSMNLIPSTSKSFLVSVAWFILM